MTSLSCFADYEITAKYEKLVKSQYCTTLMCGLSFKISIKRYTRNAMLIKGMYLKKGLWSNIFQLHLKSSDIQARTNMQASPVKYSLILDFTMRGW